MADGVAAGSNSIGVYVGQLVTNNQLIYFYIFIFLSVSIIVYRGPSPIPHPPINKSFVGTIAGNQTRTAMILPAS